MNELLMTGRLENTLLSAKTVSTSDKYDALERGYLSEQSDSIFRLVNRKESKENYPTLSNEFFIEQFFLCWAIAKHGNHRIALETINNLNRALSSRVNYFFEDESLIIRELSAQTHMICENFTIAINEFVELIKLTTDKRKKISFYLEIATCLQLNKKPLIALEWCSKVLDSEHHENELRIQANLLWIELKLQLTLSKDEMDKISQVMDQIDVEVSHLTSSHKKIFLKHTHVKYQLAALKYDNNECVLMLRKLYDHCVESDNIENAKKVLSTINKHYPQNVSEHEKILLIDELLNEEKSDVCLYFNNNKAKIQTYSAVHYNHVFIIDLHAGLFIKNSVVTAFSDIQLKTIMAVISSGQLGIKHKKLAEIVYSDEFWEIKNGEERIRKIIQKLKSFGLGIYCKDNRYFFKFENFHLILQKSSSLPHLTNYLKKELPLTFHRKDLEAKLGLKKVMSLNYIKEWIEEGRIQSFNRGKSQRYTIL
jgi:hypothetical protein